MGVAVGAAVDAAVGDRGLPWYVVGAALEIAVEITMASAMGLHGVPLLAAAFSGSPWNVRGSPWKVRDSPWSVRGCPWSAVDMAVECRGGPWAPSRYSAKKQNNVHTSQYRGVPSWATMWRAALCFYLTHTAVSDTMRRTRYQVPGMHACTRL